MVGGQFTQIQRSARNEEVDPQMITGLLFDRLGNQVKHADWIKSVTGDDIIGDEQYRNRWLKANLDIFLNGVLC